MPDALSFIFQENGDLKDEFRRYPEPVDTDDDLRQRRIDQWQLHNLDRIPDWEKIGSYLGGTEKEGEPEFERCMVISTAHITTQVNDVLGEGTLMEEDIDQSIKANGAWQGFHFTTTSGGYLMRFYEPEETWVAPLCILDIARFAKKHGCRYVRLDQDAPVAKGLHAYDW